MKKFEKFLHKSELIFFSAKGESMSDAQSMKGKCTQISEDVRAHMNSLGPVKEEIPYDGKIACLINPRKLSVAAIEALIGKDADANALNAWYADSIKAKKLLLDSIKTANWTMFLKGKEDHTPEMYNEKFDLEKPQLATFTEEDVLAQWSAKHLADYIIKEQYCATIGKLIHRKGKLHDLYNSPLNEVTHMVQLSMAGGKQDFPVTSKPVYEGDELKKVKELYLDTHDKHREAEKKLNWYKAKIKNDISALNALAQEKYATDMDAYETARKEYLTAENIYLKDARGKNTTLKAKAEARRQELTTEASDIKIFIPENLRLIKKWVQYYKVI